jgi:hypothetical protein
MQIHILAQRCLMTIHERTLDDDQHRFFQYAISPVSLWHHWLVVKELDPVFSVHVGQDVEPIDVMKSDHFNSLSLEL